MLLSAFACGSDTPDDPTDDTTAPDQSQTSDAGEGTMSFADEHAAVRDDLPETDFGGEKFVITINNYTAVRVAFSQRI